MESIIGKDITPIRQYIEAHKNLVLVQRDAILVQNQWKQSVKDSVAAVKEDMVGSLEQFSTGLASLIGGRRAQAGVEMVWEIAKGVAMLAEGAWPPNPAAIIAAGLHFEAAAQYGILAGKSGGHHHGGAGAGGGGGSSDAGGHQAVDRSGGGGSNGGSKGGGYSQTIVNIQGGSLSTNGQQQLAAWMGMGSAVGLFKFSSSGSSGIAAPRY